MKYSMEIATANKLNRFTGFVISELKRHMGVWSVEDGDSAFSIHWLKNSLIFTTESQYLLDKWMTLERSFVNSILDDDGAILSEVSREPMFVDAA